MTYAAASEITPPEYVREAAELCGLRSELSVLEPSVDDEMEESGASSRVTYPPSTALSPRTPRAVPNSALKRPPWTLMCPRMS
eukprot:13937915-Alexandrium_andersonii.AAC.1